MEQLDSRFVSAVIVAAGGSTRMGIKGSKQFLPLCGKPAIAYTLEAFEKASCIQEIVVVCREEDQKKIKELIEEYHITKGKAVVTGGSTRQQSVQRGIQQISPQAEDIAIHDGARALITPETITRVVEDAKKWKASSAAVPVKDTIKSTDPQGVVTGTPDRSVLWLVQTPQVFEKTLYLQAAEKAKKESQDYTDDCQLIEQFGAVVHLCMGSYQNIKLTTKEDISLAEQMIKESRKEYD